MSPHRPCRTRRLVFILTALLIGAPPCLFLALPVAAAEQSRITLQAEAASDGTLSVTAVVVDGTGAPVADASVVFKARTTFGWLPISSGGIPTDATGRARVVLPATFRPGEVSAEIEAEGEIRVTVRLEQRPFAPRVRPGREALGELSPQPGFISPYPVPLQVGLLALVLGGIWMTYGYVAWLLSRIRAGR